MFHQRRRGEERADDGAPLGEQRPLAESDGVVFQLVPEDLQDVAIVRLGEAGIEPSVGSKGDSYDNALAFMQASNVQISQPTRAFIEALHARTAPLEQRWIRDAKARGLANADAVLREYRTEVAKLK